MTTSANDQSVTALREGALAALDATGGDPSALEKWRVEYLGRKGRLTSVLRSLGTLPPGQRRDAGAADNPRKGEMEQAFEGQMSGSAAASSMRATRAARNSWPSALTGGLSKVMTATAPRVSP